MMYAALILDDVDRPSASDHDEDDFADSGPVRPPEDEDHMLARMAGHGSREDGSSAEGEEMLEDQPNGVFSTDWDGE